MNQKYARSGKFNSDLACERRRVNPSATGITYQKDDSVIGEWERIVVLNEDGEREIGRPKGRYDTLALPKIAELDYIDVEDAIETVAEELISLCEKNRISPSRVLVVGLGNRELTPDSVGVRVAEKIQPTMHIARADRDMFEELKCSEIAVLVPGVKGTNGIDTADVVGGLAERICPSVVIAIDSLAARSPSRLGSTIQFCDTGIHPGSGVGSHERAIDEDLVGAPVISIGVPTVIDSKLMVEGDDGGLTENMLVCPKEIDTTVEVASRIIAGGINGAFGLIF